jgi:hypothetical protein
VLFTVITVLISGCMNQIRHCLLTSARVIGKKSSFSPPYEPSALKMKRKGSSKMKISCEAPPWTVWLQREMGDEVGNVVVVM